MRESFGKPLNQHPTWREPLAEAATRLAAAWALVETAIGAVEAGAETRHLAAAAKVNAVKLAQSELPTLLHAMGAEGLRESEPFTRHIGAAQVAALTDGSTAMLLDRLGRWDPTRSSSDGGRIEFMRVFQIEGGWSFDHLRVSERPRPEPNPVRC